MAMKDYNVGLIVAIIFASTVLAGSLVFLGIQMTPKGGSGQVTVAMIEEAFDGYVKKQRQNEQDVQQQQDSQKGESAKNVRQVSVTDDHIRGNKNAKVSLIEYSDFECPFCKKFHPTAQQVVDVYGDKVNWVYRHYPLSFHDPLATKEAEASECANELGGNDKFWEYADLIYERTTSNGRGLELNELPEMAAEIGLNKAAFQKCLDSGKYVEKIQNDIADGSRAGVNGTPGNILINNETGEAVLIEGAQGFETHFKPAIDKLLN